MKRFKKIWHSNRILMKNFPLHTHTLRVHLANSDSWYTGYNIYLALAHRLNANISQLVILLPKILIEIQGREKYITGLCVPMKGFLLDFVCYKSFFPLETERNPMCEVWSMGSTGTTSTPVTHQPEAIMLSEQCSSDQMSP